MSAKAFKNLILFLVAIIGGMLIAWVVNKPSITTYHKEGNLLHSVISYHRSNDGWHTVTCPVVAWEDVATGKMYKADELIPANTQVIIYPALSSHCLDVLDVSK